MSDILPKHTYSPGALKSWLEMDKQTSDTPRTDAAKRKVSILSSRCGLARKEYNGGELEYVEPKQMEQLELELNEAKRRIAEYQPYADNALTISAKVIEWTECERERDELRNVADEVLLSLKLIKKNNQGGYVGDARLRDECINKLNSLPHVQQRNTK